jgi:uncharacterized protein YjbI with pentapeptide repeats
VVGTRIAVASVVLGLSIIATAGTSGATVGVNHKCVPRPKADLEGCDFAHADLTEADLDGADLSGATLKGVRWSDTTCPDGTNSNNDEDTCANDLG